MARIITIANNKGGVGKTTTAVSMGAALRSRGYDVLIIDYDGQANATYSLGVSASGGTIYDAMKARAAKYIQPARVLPSTDTAGVLDVLPSCVDLAALETELADKADRLTRFAAVVEQYNDQYDVIFVDTPPTFGLLTVSALYTADDLIVAVQPQYLAVKGLVELDTAIKTINENRRGRAALNVYVLITQYDRRKSLHRLTAEQVEASRFHTFDAKIRDNVALAEAPAVGVDIFRYAPRSYGAADYNALADEYLNKRKLRHVKHGKR